MFQQEVRGRPYWLQQPRTDASRKHTLGIQDAGTQGFAERAEVLIPRDPLAPVDVERLGDRLVGAQGENNGGHEIIDIEQVARPAARLLGQ